MMRSVFLTAMLLVVAVPMVKGEPMKVDDLLTVINREVSGNRARDYVMRLWQYDKWSTLPMWQNTAREAQSIMRERGFDEAEIVKTPADGFTKHGDWTNPIGWDVKQGTLEVIEPAGLPDEYRYLCNYRQNPTSLNNHSCPTPPDGIETELVMLETSTEEALAAANARGKIILVSSSSRGMKRYLDKYGVYGIVSDEIESRNEDFTTANQWLNGWSDIPGGWQMNGYDSRNNFGFSISQKKAAYLRGLMREGKTVKVRAVIDSRYITDDYLPYIVGSIRGGELPGEDVIVLSHIFEWGANDDCTGASSDLEAIGALNSLIEQGVLPRPKRTIRMWLGFEKYGSMAYAVNNIERLRTGTIAAVCCDTPAADFDASTTQCSVAMNFNACPSFTDALYPEVVGRYHELFAPTKRFSVIPFATGLDNFFGDPMIGVPLNAISMNNGGHLHHNNMDTIDKVDPRTLQMISAMNAAYLYCLANAGEDDVPYLADLAVTLASKRLLDRADGIVRSVREAGDGAALGKLKSCGPKEMEYYAGIERKAVERITRLVPADRRKAITEYLKGHIGIIDENLDLLNARILTAVKERERETGFKAEDYNEPKGDWEHRAEKIVPRRMKIGTLTLEGIPVDQWRGIRSSPRWWGATNWASASLFWCDGERNLVEIRRLVELEAGSPVTNFDLIEYYTFLEQHGLVEFVNN